MAGYMQHTCHSIVLITAFEVKARVHPHIAGWHLDVTIVGDVNTGGVVHLVIGSCGDGKRRHRPFPMVEHRINIWWEDALICVVDSYGWICPP